MNITVKFVQTYCFPVWLQSFPFSFLFLFGLLSANSVHTFNRAYAEMSGKLLADKIRLVFAI